MKEKLVKATYMCVGALIAFATYLLGNVNNSINAQPEANLPVLVVRKLYVVNAEGILSLTSMRMPMEDT